MAVFVFYGYWGRAECKVFAFSTYHRQVMAVFVLPFRPKTAPIELYCNLNQFFVPEKKIASSGPGTS